MLRPYERSLQPGLVGAGRIVPVEGLAGSRDETSSQDKSPGPPVCTESSNPDVVVMKSAKDGV